MKSRVGMKMPYSGERLRVLTEYTVTDITELSVTEGIKPVIPDFWKKLETSNPSYFGHYWRKSNEDAPAIGSCRNRNDIGWYVRLVGEYVTGPNGER